MQTGNTDFIYREMSLIKLVFNMIWVMVNQKIQQKELNQTKFYKITHLKLQVIQNMMDTKEDQLQWFTSFLIKRVLVEQSKSSQIINLKINFINRLLKSFRNKNFIHVLETIFWGVNLADMQSLNKYNKGIKYLLCENDLFSKYAWIAPLNDRRGIIIVNAFEKTISKGCKPNKI